MTNGVTNLIATILLTNATMRVVGDKPAASLSDYALVTTIVSTRVTVQGLATNTITPISTNLERYVWMKTSLRPPRAPLTERDLPPLPPGSTVTNR